MRWVRPRRLPLEIRSPCRLGREPRGTAMSQPFSFRGMVAAFTVSILIFVPVMLWLFSGQTSKAEPAPPPPIGAIQTMSHLATVKVHITDSIEGENDHWKGKW